jgi:hypothetical protein
MEKDATEIYRLAVLLYCDLPWWKRRKVHRFYRSNNWDVTDEWTKCLRVAKKMYIDAALEIEGKQI